MGHIPHGFYEQEMREFFSQFGIVTRVKLCRSENSGRSKGYGYVEFLHTDVAKIAAETMNNYLMFKRRLVGTCSLIKFHNIRPVTPYHSHIKFTSEIEKNKTIN